MTTCQLKSLATILGLTSLRSNTCARLEQQKVLSLYQLGTYRTRRQSLLFITFVANKGLKQGRLALHQSEYMTMNYHYALHYIANLPYEGTHNIYKTGRKGDTGTNELIDHYRKLPIHLVKNKTLTCGEISDQVANKISDKGLVVTTGQGSCFATISIASTTNTMDNTNQNPRKRSLPNAAEKASSNLSMSAETSAMEPETKQPKQKSSLRNSSFEN